MARPALEVPVLIFAASTVRAPTDAGNGISTLNVKPTMGPALTFVRALAAKDNVTKMSG
jgi:hypothetical protein